LGHPLGPAVGYHGAGALGGRGDLLRTAGCERRHRHIDHRGSERGAGLCSGIPGRDGDCRPKKTRRAERYGAARRPNPAVPARELVRGDVLYLEAGNLVGADCRLLEAEGLSVDEAALTGESMPVEKVARLCLEGLVPLAERRNMVYLGTAVREGRATAVVTHTGMQTELGRIADLLQQVKREATPLQRRLDRFGPDLGTEVLPLRAQSDQPVALLRHRADRVLPQFHL
jgi:E1-E2 ATPase